MKRSLTILNIILIAAMLLAACTAQTPTPTAIPEPTPAPTDVPVIPTVVPPPVDDTLYLNLTWHQHQPLYYKDEAGVYTRPWVRVHATKDYYDMASILTKYPNVHLTFNLTPVLIRQLDDYAAGAKDLYWTTAEIPADQLTDDEKRFILQRFFDANWSHIIAVHPRYQELLDKRGGTDDAAIEAALASFTEVDFRDLQIWFNLAWFDPEFLANEPLKSLVDKGSNFSEEDKTIVFDQALKVIQGIIPLHKGLQEDGQIQVITTPYAHPILPLLIDSDLAKVGNPGADLPTRFSYPDDATIHVARSVQIYQDHFGQKPLGMWPGEGSVAQVMAPFVINAGYQWMASGEPVLEKSLGISFTRDGNETVKQADDLYRPYYVTDGEGNKIAMFFRDWVISDKIGFTYSGMKGEAAAQDLIQRLENIKAQLAEQGAPGPHIVTIVVDGENAWENYDNDGKAFFDNLYRLLNESETIKTITPSEYLQKFPEQREIDDLFPGAWFSANYDTWIGESEEKTAWEYLRQTREFLAAYDTSKATPEALAEAQDYMLLAEGSDWFWWYGDDQDSGQDSYFDLGYRALLTNVYTSLGEPAPKFVSVPIIQPRPVAATQPLKGLSTPTIDGVAQPDEWANAAYYPAAPDQSFTGFSYTIDVEKIYFKVDLTQPIERLGFYFKAPAATKTSSFVHDTESENPALLSIPATHLVEWNGTDALLQAYVPGTDGWKKEAFAGKVVAKDNTAEFSIPFSVFGKLTTGDELRLVVVNQPDSQMIPIGGPAQIIMPDLDTSTPILEISDPANDDFGPGTYTYPTDAVFKPQMYDISSFRVSVDESNIIFKIATNGPITNPWGSPNNLAVQTFDVYIDKDPGAGTGARLFLPGRNAALKATDGWEYAIWAEGWSPQILTPAPDTLEPIQITEAQFKILVDPAANIVTIIVPKDVFGDGDPVNWGYAVILMGQEGYPSPGVWRIRDIAESNAQWRFGGGSSATNATRILDMVWPADATPTQTEMLSTFTPSTTQADQLTPDDFAQVELILIK